MNEYEKRMAELGISRGRLAEGFEAGEGLNTPVSARTPGNGPVKRAKKMGRPPGVRKLTLAPPLEDLTHLKAGTSGAERLRKSWLQKRGEDTNGTND